jgi:hypothetical protein
MSRITWFPAGSGTPIPSGLLPSRVAFPPQGAMVVVALLATMVAKPCSTARKA